MARLFFRVCRACLGVDTLVLHASRRVVAYPFAMVRFVLGIVAGEELHMGVAFERQDMRGDTVEEPAVVGDHRAQPGKASSASSSARRVSISRSLEGSSSSSTLAPCFRVWASCKRPRSPPERSLRNFCWSLPLKLKRPT